MKSNCFQLLRNFDIFGGVVPLQIQGGNNLKTLLGFFVTLCVAIIGMSAFVYLVKDMSDRKSPVVYEHTLQTFEKYEGHTFPPGEFISTVTLGDQYYNPIINTIEKTYFQVRFQFCHGNDNCWYVNSEPCPQANADQYYEWFQLNKTLTKLSYCLNQTYWKTEPVVLEGNYLSVDFKRVEVLVERCTNSTDNDYICATKEEIDDKLDKSHIVYGIQDSQFDRNNFENPFRRDFQYFTQTIHFDYPQTAYIRYNVAEVTSIENYLLLWPQTTINKALQFSDSFVDVTRVDKNVVGKSIFTLTMTRNYREREYKNIIQAFGTIGGLLSLVTSVARILMLPFNWIALRIYLMGTSDEQLMESTDKSTTKKYKIWKILKLRETRNHFINKSQEALQYLEVQQVISAVQFFVKWQQKQSLTDCQLPNCFNSIANQIKQPEVKEMKSPVEQNILYHQLSQMSSIPNDPQFSDDKGRAIMNLIIPQRQNICIKAEEQVMKNNEQNIDQL